MLRRVRSLFGPSSSELDRLRTQVGGIEARMIRKLDCDRIRDAGFRVFSQWGEDGILQYLIAKASIPSGSRRFVEFGVADYSESNTRFLLTHDDWGGLILDGDDAHIDFVQKSGLAWRHTIVAEQCFITRDNVAHRIEAAGFSQDLGLLSIDIDGNDYWVWEALGNLKAVIVAVEYNSLFGPTAAVSIPYQADFQRTVAHHSNLYFGASLGALVYLGSSLGYRFVGSNAAGNNAFFVREDAAGDLPSATARDEWVASRFRESRGPTGELTYVTAHSDRRRLIAHLPLVDVVSGQKLEVGDLA